MTSRVSSFLGARVASLLEHEGAAAAAAEAAAAARGDQRKRTRNLKGGTGGSITHHASQTHHAPLDLGDDVSKPATSCESDLIRAIVCWSSSG
jgi:hypothetical protein